MRQDRTKVTIEVQYEVIYALSIGTKISDVLFTHFIAQNSLNKVVATTRDSPGLQITRGN